MRGSLLLVFGGAAVYLLVALGIGLWISTIVETQQQAMFVTFAVNMVYLLMSGLFTPILSMPWWAQWIAQLSPVKHFIVLMRAVLVKGAGFSAVRVPLAVLAIYAAVVLTLAVRQYSKRTA
jgi:ABC-2 type transport system permease protein